MQHSKVLYEKGIIKNRKMLTQSQYENYKLVCRLEHIKTLYSSIKAICFSDFGTLQASEDGLLITVEQGKSIQATLFIAPAFFAEFKVDGSPSFSVKMNVLAECLSLFGLSDCSIKILYKGEGAPLLLLLEPHDDDQVSTECSIKTTNVEEPMEYDLDANSSNKAADEFEFTISPLKPHFKIITLGVMQAESSVEVAKSSDMVILFNCRATTVARYKSQQIKLTNKAMQVASKVAIKTDASGLLEMHFMMQCDDQEEMYVRFFITPLLEVDGN
ncbi:PREDICTED: cell cycle checkpoint protein RAD1 isoform X2 [Drosophila arizonae]|uniref:Cell cycle checkpoint protein RAD1 isoform X2 n=1 Tax=Drosophila arizonae TaxID=7263 RepID=A0ABM1P7E7_DROAR|nr:PREDICTED: cell cycle checkpoint protein RAD1 isoform X2 [Drosophila arizonae]